MRKRSGGNVCIEFSFENEDGDEITLDVEASIEPYSPAVLNPVDMSHPEEGGGIEDLTLKLKGVVISLDDAIAMGLDNDSLEQEIYDAAANVDDDSDYDDYDRDDDFVDMYGRG